MAVIYAQFRNVVNSLGLYPAARSLRIWLDHHTPWGIRRRRRFQRFYSQFLGPGALCLDIGANVGDRAEIFLDLGARVVCVEPQADCVQVLRRRFRDHGNLVVVQSAVGERQGTADFRVCESNPALSTLTTKWIEEGRHAGEYDWNRTVQVPVTTLDALIASHGIPRFCKIDVEGGEEGVLRGLTQPIPTLSLEFRAEMMDELKACMDRVLAVGAASFNCTIFDAVEMLCSNWMAADDLYARVKSLKDPGLWGDLYVRFEEAASRV